MDVRERMAEAGYAAGWKAARVLPEGPAHRIFDLAARWAATREGTGARQLRRNLARVVPNAAPAELDQLVLQGLRSYARYWCEAFRLPAMDPGRVYWTVDMDMHGMEHVDAALAAGRGALIALPHTGNWDAGGVYLAGRVGGFTTVVERLRPESLYRRFVAYRESLGFEVLPVSGDRETSRTLVRRLRENRVVCLVADRDLTATGLEVDFFGEPARMPSGPAALAAMTGAPLMPAACWYTETGWGFRVSEPLRVTRGRAGMTAATQALADAFATEIAARPADWHMLQPLWTADVAGTPATPVATGRRR